MPITKSAKKALRQSLKRKKRNIVYKNKIKDLVKRIKSLVIEKKNAVKGEPRQKGLEEAKKLLPQLYKALDKASKVGVIKKNTASRRKSRITKALNKDK